MTDFASALNEKILDLQGRRDELEEELASVDARIEVLSGILAEEQGKPVEVSEKKKRGRPAGSKSGSKATPVNTPVPADDPVLREALTMEGTDPVVAERLKKRFNPQRRAPDSRGPGIRAGNKQDVLGETRSDKTINVDDNTKDA